MTKQPDEATAADRVPDAPVSRPAQRWGREWPWLIALLIPFALQFSTPGFIGNDTPFHARYANRFFAHGLARRFPAIYYSIWRDHWGDKEFLYHAYLAPFCQSERFLLFGAKFASALLFAAILATLGLILRRQGVRYAALWVVALPFVSSIWTFRMLMARSHVASVLLLLWAVHLFERRQRKPLLVLMFFYTWTYTIPILALLFCGLYAFGRWLADTFRPSASGSRAAADTISMTAPDANAASSPDANAASSPDANAAEKFDTAPIQEAASEPTRASNAPPDASPLPGDRALLRDSLLATLLGLIIHPQTPNQLLSNWIHFTIVTAKGWGVTQGISQVGGEFLSDTFRAGFSLHAGVAFLLALAWLLAAFCPAVLSVRARALLWLTLPLTFLYGMSGRFIEYLAPFTVWAAASVMSEISRANAWPRRFAAPRYQQLARDLSLVALCALAWVSVNTLNKVGLRPRQRLAQDRAGAWLRAHVQPDDLIIAPDWGQFPQLYYYAPDCRFVAGLEPTMTEIAYPEQMTYLEALRFGRNPPDFAELQRLFPGARYLVVARYTPALRQLANSGWRPLFDGGDALIYDARPAAAFNPLAAP